MMRKFVYSILIITGGLFGCSTTKNIPAGDRLYTGATIKWEEGKKKDKKELGSGLSQRLRPKANSRLLGMPFKLWIYNLANPKKKKGIHKLLRNTGEPPVLFSSVKPSYTSEVLQSYLGDNGFFQATVTPQTINKGDKKASVGYSIKPQIRYAINKVVFEMDTTTTLGKDILRTQRRTLLKKGDFFKLDIVSLERDRIFDRLKQRGYYFYDSEDLIAEVDTTNQGVADIYLKVKPNIPKRAGQIYRIKKVTIYTNYSLEDSTQLKLPAVQFHDLHIVDPDKLYRASVFDHAIFLRPDSLYRLRTHNITLQRLVGLGTFKYVRAQFRPSRSDTGALYANFFLTPYQKRSLQFQVTGTSKSNNFVGSEIQIIARNRNYLKAANQLDIRLGGGFETQVGGGKQQLSSTAGYSVNAGVSLTIPRFFFPPFEYNLNSAVSPRTRFSLDYELLTRRNLYNLNGFKFDLSYIWKPKRYTEHNLSPISVSLVVPSGITPLFDSILQRDPTLRQSLEKQFILGTNYTITYNNQTARRVHSNYLSGNIDLSGNLFGLFIKEQNGTKNLLGTPFAQFTRLTGEGRHYWNLNANAKTQWIFRALIGYGLPYGNSTTLPFVKQFFIGGSNSIRAFRSRTLGPGTYRDTTSFLFANQAGDIKIELNTELRAKLFSIVHGALFVDAGNIWLTRDDVKTGKGGGKFNFGGTASELAIGAGAGLRVDASILVVRFDLAFPLRKPWLPKNERWVLDQIDFGKGAWRQENLILNIAIGYPF
ncbi:MAG: BamA/TamA family outer membrane protein [Chitinophagaceae bacterium]|nr:BamA/TamA family outer membrane protein [Chitinophagaceae bacterium]